MQTRLRYFPDEIVQQISSLLYEKEQRNKVTEILHRRKTREIMLSNFVRIQTVTATLAVVTCLINVNNGKVTNCNGSGRLLTTGICTKFQMSRRKLKSGTYTIIPVHG